MAGYIGTKAALLSTTASNVVGDSTVGGDLTVDTDTLYVDSANNRVGIGTSSPATALDVSGTVTADGLTSAGNVLVSQASSNSSITINRTDSASQYNLTMGQSGLDPYITGNDARTFSINVDPDNTEASSIFRVNIDGTERKRIDASGHLLVGTTSTGVESCLLYTSDAADE